MKEKTLLKIALICSLAGLFILYIISENTPIKEKTIDKIDKSNYEEDVKIRGIVDNVVYAKGAVIVNIVQPQKISVVLFKAKGINISKGSEIEVIGKIEEYNGKMEIVGNRVRVID